VSCTHEVLGLVLESAYARDTSVMLDTVSVSAVCVNCLVLHISVGGMTVVMSTESL